MAAPTNAANVKKVLVNSEPSTDGTSRTSQDVRLELAKWGKADLDQVAVTNCNFMNTRPSHGRARNSSRASTRCCCVSFSTRSAAATRSMAMARRVAAQSDAALCTTALTTSGMCRGIAIAEHAIDFTPADFESGDGIGHRQPPEIQSAAVLPARSDLAHQAGGNDVSLRVETSIGSSASMATISRLRRSMSTCTAVGRSAIVALAGNATAYRTTPSAAKSARGLLRLVEALDKSGVTPRFCLRRS